MHKLKQFTFALAAVCALSTACGQSGTAETPSASAAETKAETTVETTAAVESKAAVASGNETAAEQTIDTGIRSGPERGNLRYFRRVQFLHV